MDPTKNDAYDGEFTDAEAQQARAYLSEHGGPVQKKLIENHDTDDAGRQLYLVNDTLTERGAEERSQATGEPVAAGEEIVFVTSSDEMIVSYYRRLQAEPLWAAAVGCDGGTILPDGGHRFGHGD